MPSADFSDAVGPPCEEPSPPMADTPETSRGKFDRLRRTPAESTPAALDEYGLCGQAPARPTTNASIRFLSIRPRLWLPASFRPRLAATPLRLARTSPPSGCAGDFHPQVVEHARHTPEARFAGKLRERGLDTDPSRLRTRAAEPRRLTRRKCHGPRSGPRPPKTGGGSDSAAAGQTHPSGIRNS